ncbi:MAG: NgoBV family restriction endonuclease [Muribaculaceae bacterium]|nr:NgoBV family restriction endonuclease [Muribaculaceae bacterium]
MTERIRLTAEQVYESLVNVDKIKTVEGQIRFFLGNVDIIVRQKDVVGNIIQEWLEGWLKKNNVAFDTNPNTQMPPDIFLNPDDHTVDLLEVKAFNYAASPGFDIADFKAYAREILEHPYMLHTKYIIFGYSMSDDGIVTIKDIWLKNVWEICRSMDGWPLNVQYKNKVIHKIRPAKWYGKQSRFPMFQSMEHYLSAIEETLFSYHDTHALSVGWRKKVVKAYKEFCGKTITIPRWEDLDEFYRPPVKPQKKE